MAYGIWLYKEITTSNGVIRLEIKKKNYTGESIEIEALLKDGLTLQVDGRDITDPIIGTTLSISLIDTGQIDTSQFFTPDATLYQVVLYRDSVRIWIGYLTPDSYSENLVYSDVINLTARDNLGRLNDFIYDKSEGLQAVYQFIESLCERASISMPLVFYSGITAKRIAESEVDTSLRGVAASVDTLRFVGMNYREIVEMILKGIGCQMRYSYNTDRGYFLGVYDISQLYSELSTQEAFFVEKSGYKEIKPAWREVLIEQDYGLSSNLFDGYFSKDELAGAETFIPEDIDNNRWGGDGSMLFCNQYLAKVDDFQSTSLFIAADRSDSYCFYRKNVFKSDNVLTFKMQLNNTLRMMPSYVSDYDTIGNLYVGYHIESDPDLQPVQYFETYTLKYKFNVYLVGRDTGITYVMRDKWIPLSEDDAEPITFEMAQVWYNDPSLWDRIEQVEIVVNSTPEDGELRLVVYAAEGAAIAPLSTIHQTTFAKISNIEIAYQNDIQGASSRIEVNAAHNLKSNINLEIGQVPNNKGNNLAYWGGLFDSAGYPLNSWVLNDGDIVRYNLMELVARQHIHQNSKNYALLSGVMMSDSALSLTHNITYKGKVYSILSASHNLINGKMNVTSMQEIEAYQVAELTVIDSPLESSSGTRLGSGDNEVIQFSNDAGNAKRIYELDLATDEDKEESYVIIDKGSLDSARRIPLTDVGGLFNKAFKLHYNEDGVLVSVEVLANLWTNFGISAGGEGTGSGGGGGGGLTEFSIIINGTTYNSENGTALVSEQLQPLITDDNKLAYSLISGTPTLAAVATSGAYSDLSGTPNLGSLAYKNSLVASDIPNLSWNKITSDKPTTLSGYGITDATFHFAGNGYAGSKVANGNIIQYGENGNWRLTDNLWSVEYVILHHLNYSSYALPLSGGTIEGGSGIYTPLTIKSTNLQEVWIGFQDSIGTCYIGSVMGVPSVTDGTKNNALIHSGNIGDQSVANADTLDGYHHDSFAFYSGDITTLGGSPFLGYAYPTNGWATYGPAMTFGSGQYYLQFQYIYNATSEPYIRTHCPEYGYSSWQQLAYLTSNVASATKLQTARTIWGQPFDGTGSIWGGLEIHLPDNWNYVTFISPTSNGLTIETLESGVEYKNIILNPNGGNVLIGTTSDSGAKLNVNGNISASGAITAGTASDIRLKDNIQSITENRALEVLMSLNPITFTWNDKAKELGGYEGVSQGFVAQEYESIIPNSGRAIWGEYRAIDYTKAIPFMVSVEQNHEQRIKQLEDELKRLRREYYGIQ